MKWNEWFNITTVASCQIFSKSSNYYLFVYVLAAQNSKHSAKRYETIIQEILRRSGYFTYLTRNN